MKMSIVSILSAAAVAVLAAGCHHHHDRDYYRPGPSHHYNHGNGWHNGNYKPRPNQRPHHDHGNPPPRYPGAR